MKVLVPKIKLVTSQSRPELRTITHDLLTVIRSNDIPFNFHVIYLP